MLAGSYAVGWFVGPHGFQVLSFTGADSDNPVLRDGIPLVSSTASWTAVHLAALAGLRALPAPRLLAVPAYAAALAAVEPRVLWAVEAAADSGRG